jgi:hypothetical protein
MRAAPGVFGSGAAGRSVESQAWKRSGQSTAPTAASKLDYGHSNLRDRTKRDDGGGGLARALCGTMQTMPGLGASAAAFQVDIDGSGRTVGLF